MNAFNFLDPIFVSPVAEIERGFFRSPKSYVLVVSKKSIQRATEELKNGGDVSSNNSYGGDDDDYGRDGDDFSFHDGGASSSQDATEILFFNVHQDAAKWLLDASFNAGYELLKRGQSNISFRLDKYDLRGAPRGEGSTMASIFIRDESSPKIFSFESSLRRDIFLRATRSFVVDDAKFGNNNKDGLSDDYYGRGYDDYDSDEEEEDPNQGAVVWDKQVYQVDKDFEAEVFPAKGVLAIALSSANNQNQNTQTTNLTQREELTLAREMIRNPMFHRRADLTREQQQQQSSSSNNNNNNTSSSSSSATQTIPSSPAQAPTSIFNLPLFQADCSNKIAATDIKIASLIVNESDRWLDMLQDIQQLDEETILHLEARIENFSHELLSRRSIIDEIEKESIMRQQIKKNLTQVISQLKGVNLELNFTRSAKRAIETLNAIQLSSPDELEKAIRTNSVSIEDGKNTIETVLATRKLIESKYSKLQAIVDRCDQFKTLRRDIARRVRGAMMHAVNNWKNTGSSSSSSSSSKWQQQDRSSNDSTSSSILTTPRVISLTPPSSFLATFDDFSVFMETVRSSDLAGYYASARSISKRVNEITVPQIGKFFVEMRRRVAQMPSLANLRFSSGRQMNFDVDDFVSASFVKRLYHSYELTPTALIPSVKILKMRKKLDEDKNDALPPAGSSEAEGTFIGGGGGYRVLSANVIPFPEIKLAETREGGISVLLPQNQNFSYFFALLEKETRTNESYKTGFLNRVLRGGEDPWACRADIALACCAKAVTDLVLNVRSFFVSKYKLMSADPYKDGSWASALSAHSAAFSTANNNFEENEEAKSVWERADEVNTFLWLCFRREGKNNLRSSAAMEFGWELIRMTEFIFEKCDLLFAIPIASILDSLIDRIDDGDAFSSKPISKRVSKHESIINTTDSSSSSKGDNNNNNNGNSDGTEKQQQAPSIERSGFLSHVLASSLTIALEKLNLYIAVQIEAMRNSARKFATKGPKVENLLPAFLVFPIALNRIETLLSQQFSPSYNAFEMFLNSIVPQMFSTLDAVTFRDDPTFTGGNYDALPAQDSDFIQFVHHSLFCVAVQNAVLRKTKEILRGRLSYSESRRDQYEQRYILRSLFSKCFPQFASTAEVAEGIIKRTINDAEADSAIRNMFDTQTVTKLCEKSIPREIPVGIIKAKEKVRRHVARLVSSGELSISNFLVEVVKTCLDHLLFHLMASLSTVERVRSIVTPAENRKFQSECSTLLEELSSSSS